ncbi:UDP-N-acetylmuramate--L-alanine ligase, partial [Nitrolancea hollandica]|uniref:UDP-N-acetylmuramate--L-alanine ligase n=1 Tax=Nitrolancea hollandica TaxID=1206749 RepID=UPI001EE672CB
MEHDYLLSRMQLPPPPATIHFVGIGGIGMSGLARIVAARGYQVTGSDASDSPSLAALRHEGFTVTVGHSAAGLGDPALVVTTAAAPESNPELTAARERAIPIVKRAALLGLLCNDQVCVAVAGTHGKSTTSGMLAVALDQAGINPSFAVGARVNQLGANAGAGRSEVFVAEADEYDYSFLWLRPAVGIITNIEFDHPDIFPSLSAVEDAFLQFAERIRTGGTLVISADDPGCRRLIARLQSPIIKTTFGVHPDADWRVVESDGAYAIRTPGGPVIPLHLQVPGRHNLLNAAAAMAAGAALGISPPLLRPGLQAFTGVGRRFDVRGEVNG